MTTTTDVDRRMLQSYLSDHLAGATGARSRLRKMCQWYADLDVIDGLEELTTQVEEEHAHLAQLVEDLDLRPGLPLQATAKLGELAGRLKTNGRILAQAPVTPLLELEMLRGAVRAKQGLWQTLATYADDLGLNGPDYEARAETAERQGALLDDLHARLRPSALRPPPSDAG